MGKSKGTPARKRSRSRSRAQDVELGFGAGDPVQELLRTILPIIGPRIVERVMAPPKTPAADLEGRLLRMETQVGYLSTTLRALADRVVVLESERKH